MQEQVNAHTINDADFQLLQLTKGQILDDPFFYVFPLFTNIAAAGSQQQVIQFQADSYFRIEQIALHFNLANATFQWATRNIPNASLVLTDSGSGRQLMNGAIPLTALSGYDGSPFILPIPKIMNPSATMVGVVSNFDAAVATGQYIITLIGRKLYNVIR